MSSSSSTSSKPPPHLRLHVDTTTTNGSAVSPGSASSSHSSRSPRPSSAPAGAGAGAGGSGQSQTHQACAACKYQRRKCSPDCPLAPYFPADQQRLFLNAHRLFGVRNLQRTLDRIDPEHGPAAMRSLIFQSEARAADPVGGCVGIIEDLQREIQRTQLQLAYVKHQIAIYRQAAAAAAAAAAGDPLAADPAAMILPAAAVAGHGHGQDNAVAVDAFYAGDPPGAGLVFQDQRDYDALKIADDPNHPNQQQEQLYNYFCYDGGTAGGGEEANSHALGEQMEQHCQIEVEAAVPFVDAFDVKPQGLPAATERRHGPADVGYREENVATVLKHDVDQHMEEPARTGGAPCHLELGFSS